MVFYNAFVPTNEGDNLTKHALGIIQSQLEDIAKSYAASHPEPLVVYYNSIGNRILNQSVMADLCGENLRCQHLNHYDKGYEEVTLDEAYRYCRNQDHDQKR